MIAALDIGTSTIKVLIAEMNESGSMDITGVGIQPSKGLKRGIVVDIESTVQSIMQAVRQAQDMAGVEISNVVINLSGGHIQSINTNGMTAIYNGEVSKEDIARVQETAKSTPIPSDQQVLHVIPQEYMIDGQTGIREPVGMSGVRLEARLHMITSATSAIQNVTKCVERCGLNVSAIRLGPLASSDSILTDDEKELGVCLIDIGGGTSEISIYTQGAIRYTSIIPIAGDQVTNDIAIQLRTPTGDAEHLKIKHGCALAQISDYDSSIEVPSVGVGRSARMLSQSTLAEVIEPRYEELFNLVNDHIKHSGYAEMIGAGVVITGGAAQIPGAEDLAEEVFAMPVRVGRPVHDEVVPKDLSDAQYATVLGLARYASQLSSGAQNARHKKQTKSGDSFWTRAKNWIGGNY